MILNALVIDDENVAAKTLRMLLEKQVDGVQVVGVANSVQQALQLIEELPALDVVFLDIEMPKANGFDFLEQCPNRQFDVVFTTAYSAYAIKAFKYSAIDYLLKPIDIDELRRAVERVNRLRTLNFDTRQRYNALFDNIRAVLPTKLVVSIGNRSECIDLSQVLFMEQQSAATVVNFADGSTMQVDDALSDLSDIVDAQQFAYIEPQRVVKVSRVVHVGRDTLRLDMGLELPLDSTCRAALVDALDAPTTNQF